MNNIQDTIAAISTGSGSAGIGIIRVSGEDAISVCDRIFRSVRKRTLKESPSAQMLYGHIVDPSNNTKIDEVLVVKMKGPHSYTAEDVVEINCHGGIVPSRRILRLLLGLGIRHAEPGEFTKRAFLNGRIDLTQAESVMDVIASKSEKALEISVNQLSGSLKNRIRKIDQILIDLLVLIESNLDYPEYDIEELTNEKVIKGIDMAEAEIQKILSYAQNTALLREGVKTAIIGKPNVGKSSLLNLLLGEDRAIVSNIPGTTRDVIQESILIDSIPFVMTDTAGIRQTQDIVEKIGVDRSKKAVEQADLVLCIRDITLSIDQEEKELIASLNPEKTLFILNKSDQIPNVSRETLEKQAHVSRETNTEWIELSVQEESGIEKLKKAMAEKVLKGEIEGSENALMLNERQHSLMHQVLDALNEAKNALEAGMPAEIYSIDITAAEEKLREITGEALGEDVINTIFARFCIGK